MPIAIPTLRPLPPSPPPHARFPAPSNLPATAAHTPAAHTRAAIIHAAYVPAAAPRHCHVAAREGHRGAGSRSRNPSAGARETIE